MAEEEEEEKATLMMMISLEWPRRTDQAAFWYMLYYDGYTLSRGGGGGSGGGLIGLWIHHTDCTCLDLVQLWERQRHLETATSLLWCCSLLWKKNVRWVWFGLRYLVKKFMIFFDRERQWFILTLGPEKIWTLFLPYRLKKLCFSHWNHFKLFPFLLLTYLPPGNSTSTTPPLFPSTPPPPSKIKHH